MGKNLKSDAVDHLFEAIMTLQNMDEYYAFFEDVCTVNELLSLSQRYEVARMLRQHKTYLDIAEKTGAVRNPSFFSFAPSTAAIVCATLGFSAITKINDNSSFRVKEKSNRFFDCSYK